MDRKSIFYHSVAATFVLACLGVSRAGDEKIGPDPKEVQEVVDKAVAFLKSKQGKDGSFAKKVGGPGVSALVVAALAHNGVSSKEPVMANTLAYLEKQVQADGGIYNERLANYTTSVAIIAFHDVNKDGKYDSVIKNATKFLKGIQQETDAKNVRYGGFGYDSKTRPDTSNTAFAVQALLAAGVPKDDPAVQKALTFLSRCQNLPGETNDQKFATKTTKDDKGGFVYTPIDPDDSKHKTPEGGLRSQGAMTYSGLKSFLYAGVSKDDPRVKAAVAWIREHYTLDENPGMGKAGLYYYYHTFGKAMQALGEDRFEDSKKVKHDWRRDLFQAIKKRQRADGSWINEADKTFGESNAELATTFAILSLSYCQPKR